LFLLKGGDVIYTTDHKWAVALSALKRCRVIHNRIIFKWAGFDLNWSPRPGLRTSVKKSFYRGIVRCADVIFLASVRQRSLVAERLGPARARLEFWPTAVDTAFYRKIAIAHPGSQAGLVAVGSDRMRDWPTIIEIARRGIAVTVLTEDPKTKALIEAEGANRPASLRLEYDVGLRRSAEIMSQAKALIISTLPNDRFSGSTTVGVAAALGKPLILDEPYDLEAYGLVAGVNCERFERGDVASALQAIDRVYSAPDHARDLSIRIGELAESLNISHFAAALAWALRSDSIGRAFSSAAQAVQTQP
jgi:hypothetical protein